VKALFYATAKKIIIVVVHMFSCIDFCSSRLVENQKIKCTEPMGYTPVSYVIGKRNDGTLRIMMP
jgi:hypothetical protein